MGSRGSFPLVGPEGVQSFTSKRNSRRELFVSFLKKNTFYPSPTTTYLGPFGTQGPRGHRPQGPKEDYRALWALGASGPEGA